MWLCIYVHTDDFKYHSQPICSTYTHNLLSAPHFLCMCAQNSISEERDEFQGLVLAVLQKEVVPEFKILRGELSLSDPTVEEVLTKSVTELCGNLNCLTALSPKQGFYWGIVATFSSKIPVTVDRFSWIQDYHYLINQLCHIYKSYCNGQGIRTQEEKKTILTESNDIKM